MSKILFSKSMDLQGKLFSNNLHRGGGQHLAHHDGTKTPCTTEEDFCGSDLGNGRGAAPHAAVDAGQGSKPF